MSIRHYNPRRRRRSGISPIARNLLATFVGATILLQISYPLIDGEPLRLVTIATVVVCAIAMVLHGHFSYGFKYSSRYLPITYAFGLGVEALGVHTSWPFGVYEYDASLGPQLFGVPLVVPCAWVMMVHPCLCAARRIAGNWVFLYGGALLMAWDLFLDPQMVAAGRWTWEVTGAHAPFTPDIPLSNPFGWLLAGVFISSLLNRVLPRERRKEGASLRAVDALLLWTLFGGVVGNLFFFDRPGLAIFAGVIMGSLLTPYFFSSWLGSKE
ncbi:MAG: carotenoid biosynthesis protein [Candidatus Planktophila sp.]